MDYVYGFHFEKLALVAHIVDTDKIHFWVGQTERNSYIMYQFESPVNEDSYANFIGHAYATPRELFDDFCQMLIGYFDEYSPLAGTDLDTEKDVWFFWVDMLQEVAVHDKSVRKLLKECLAKNGKIAELFQLRGRH